MNKSIDVQYHGVIKFEEHELKNSLSLPILITCMEVLIHPSLQHKSFER